MGSGTGGAGERVGLQIVEELGAGQGVGSGKTDNKSGT